MERSTLGWLVGVGCGCLSFVVALLLTAGAVVGAAWYTWEAGIQEPINGPVSMGLGSVLGLIVGAVAGAVVLLVMKKVVGGGSPEAS